MKRSIIVVLLALVAVWTHAPEVAGGNRGGAPRQPRKKIDATRYWLGKNVFLESRQPRRHWQRPQPEPLPDVFEQELRLMELQGQLMAEEQKEIRLVDLAGKINTEQFGNLRYFVETRKTLETPIEPGKFWFGSEIFTSKDFPTPVSGERPDADIQKLRLTELQSQLSEQDRSEVDLLRLEGKLSGTQLEALEYYVSLRYKVPRSLDPERYYLGEQTFLGKEAPGQGSRAQTREQEERLWELDRRLPRRLQRRFRLRSLAGRLEAAKLEALEYYLEIRHGIGMERAPEERRDSVRDPEKTP